MAESPESTVPNDADVDQDSESTESLDHLSSSRRSLLKRVGEFLENDAVVAGTLNDLPLITVQLDDLVSVCQRLKSEESLDFKK